MGDCAQPTQAKATNFRRPDGGIHTIEGNVAGGRAAQLEKKRQRDQEEFEHRKQKIVVESSKHQSIANKFSAGVTASSAQEKSFKAKTVGLVTAKDFKALAKEAASQNNNSGRNRNNAVGPRAEEEEELPPEERAKREKRAEKARKKRRKEKKKIMSTLSFAGEEEEDPEEDDDGYTTNRTTKATSKKDPTVDTSFLPDRARDERAKAERERLVREWNDRQEEMKKERLEVVYSYWDGSGHRRTVICRKGDTVGDFLESVRRSLCVEFRELNGTSSDALLYVKEDLIIPQDMTFYDLIATKARGKSGPLFHFDVHEDVRIGALDTRIEKDESHPGKVVERRWYERNKHIFPASRWELYDPAKDYGRYTIHGGEVNKGK